MTLILTPLPGFPLVNPGDNLADLIVAGLQQAAIVLQEDDVLVIAQKIVSKAEGRLVNLATIVPSERALKLGIEAQKDPRLVEVILAESQQVLRVRPGTIIVEHRLGFVCASAGVDHSNVAGKGGQAEDWVLLLPKDPEASACILQQALQDASGVRLGIIIIDSHGRAWRLGTVGVAIGIAGLPGVVDLRGQEDLFGYRLQITQVGAVDELAAAASLVMGQAAEATPVVHVRGFPYPLREGSMREIIRPRDQDLFR
jgi:coenzyme F420-0:L-glutamate ligase/coenzyme F420-1:gamma-L-glutamate ligase